MSRRGVFPGSFDPLTIAHVAIVDAAVAQCELSQLDLVISRQPLAKPAEGHQPAPDRVADVARVRSAERPWLRARITEQRLLVDIAAGYDLLVMGADKWHQIHEVGFYDDEAHRDASIRALPAVALVPRAGFEVAPAPGVAILDLPASYAHVSSTAVRAGAAEWRA